VLGCGKIALKREMPYAVASLSHSAVKSVAPIVAAIVLMAPVPAFAQYGAAQAGALAYCAARANGRSPGEADRAAGRAVYEAVGLVNLTVHRNDLRDQVRYAIAQMCPGQ
jgi:hypothetical protein